MSSATLVLHKSKKPLVKSLALLLLLFGLLGSLGWTEAIINDQVIHPFLILLSTPFLFSLFRRENPMRPLIACFVPAGIAVGALNLMERLLVLDDAKNAIASPTIYGPIAVGLVLSYVCRAMTSSSESKARSTDVVEVLVCLAATIAFISAYIASSLYLPSVYLSLSGLITTLGVVLCCFTFNDQAQCTFGAVIARAGLFTCLLAAVHAVTLYTAGVEAGDPKTLGAVLGESFNLVTYGALLVISGSAVSPSEDRALMTRDWHLTEAYVFITLIIFPPLTLLEFMSTETVG